MKGWALGAILLVFLLPLCFIFFTVFDSVFYDVESGLNKTFDDAVSGQFDDAEYNEWVDARNKQHSLWGITLVVFVGVAILIFIIYAFKTRRPGGYE